jgi:hypothetical protein
VDKDPPLNGRELVVREQNRFVAPLLVGLMALGLLGFAGFMLANLQAGALGVHLFVIASLIRRFGLRDNRFSKPVRRAVNVGKEGELHVGDRVIPKGEIVDGWYQPRASTSPTVQLVNKRRRVVFEADVANEAEAVALLKELGVDASKRRATFSIASPVAQSQWRSAGVIALTMGASSMVRNVIPHFGMLQALVVLSAVIFLLIPARIDVGLDGVLIRWMGTRKFIPLASIKTASATESTGIRLELRDGKTETIQTASGKQRYNGGAHREHRDLVLVRIREALAAHGAVESGADVAALVARAGRTIDEWKTALTKLAGAQASYREAAVRDEDLWRLVEDPRADEDARAGAALVLRSKLDDDGKARVRIAAEASASPKLRVALEAASDGSEEAAFEALDEIKPRRAVASEGP